MTRFIIIFNLTIFIFSCDLSKKNDKDKTYNKESELISELPKVDFLNDFSLDFIEKNEIDQWTKFISFKESIESISNLDPQGITFYLDELEKKIQELLDSSIPEKFNSPTILSRIKVIQMQVMKCKFYSENQENNKLGPALSEMYRYYNSLLQRMISFVEEEKALPVIDLSQ
tara:strand:- start:847 stop:1362 length:516 start_codon:yes stop_codon:yes gene_type:complete